MNLKKTPVNSKKIPYYLLLILLTIGASLILGFLSFSGMYAIVPMLSVGFAAFVLSVAYEGEIYLQNIKGALQKLTKTNYLENHLAKEYLLLNFPDTEAEDCPQFFKVYESKLKLLHHFNHKNLNKDSKKRKKQIETELKDMEKWFALQLFTVENDDHQTASPFTEALKSWLANKQQKEWQERLKSRNSSFFMVKAFSTLAAVFMGFGTTYLIVEAFSVIPLFMAIPFVFWPIIILPMAIIAGAAYGLLTYNAVTDLINNDTIKKWFNKLKNDLSQGFTLRNVVMSAATVMLVALAIGLTICTAGTWWTIATKARPLFGWMKKIPSFVMGVINPIITGLSAVFFAIENTSESMEMIDKATQVDESIFYSIWNSIRAGLTHVYNTENWIQMMNPFRILLKLTLTPLRIILFLGHLISIGVTADRVPGVPQIVAALIAIISEGFEDLHYFVGQDDDHHHEAHDTKSLLEEHLDSAHGHNHDLDIPTRILNILAMPLYFLATCWDYQASQHNAGTNGVEHAKSLSFSEAWNKQRGVPEEHNVTLKDKSTSNEWKIEHTVFLIEKYKTKHLKNAVFDKQLAEEKVEALSQLQSRVRNAKEGELSAALKSKDGLDSINKHRMFANKDEKTTTQLFVDYLPERVNCK